jgi:DNA-binding IclR family transcriptional regulator
MSSKSASSKSSNQSTDKVLSILEVMAEKGGPMRLLDLAQALDFQASTVLRFITTLERRGYVAQDENTQEYSLTYKLSRIANQFNARHNPFEHIHSYLKHLSQAFNVTALVAIEEDMMAVCVDAVPSKDRNVFSLACIGNAAPLYCTAVGKLFLMNRTDMELNEYFATHKLLNYAPNTITSKVRLVKELEEVRRVGYAFDNEECDLGMRGISAPVFDFAGCMKAGISINAPVKRLTDEMIKENVPLLMTISQIVSSYLGYKPAESSHID